MSDLRHKEIDRISVVLIDGSRVVKKRSNTQDSTMWLW